MIVERVLQGGQFPAYTFTPGATDGFEVPEVDYANMTQAERERAERDLERDPKFRETVIRLAERLRSSTQAHQTDLWRSVQESIAGLPQMRDAPLVHPFAPSAAPSQAEQNARKKPVDTARPQH